MKTSNYRYTLLIIGCLLLSMPVVSQQPRTIREPAIGVEFIAPDGWQYQRAEMGYIMGHNTIAGLIIVATIPYKTMAEMRQGALEGIQEEGGTMLQLQGDLQPFGSNGLAGTFAGTLEGEPAKAYVIGVLNTAGGPAVNCMILTTPSLFGKEHIKALESLAQSFTFFTPEQPDVVKEWQSLFTYETGCRLKYLTSSGSSDYGGGYSSSSSEETIDLCPNGRFGFSSSSSNTFDISAGFGNAYDSDQGTGTWEIGFNGENAVLVLNFDDGRVFNYELTSDEENKTYLSGSRYFVLFGEDGPGCY